MGEKKKKNIVWIYDHMDQGCQNKHMGLFVHGFSELESLSNWGFGGKGGELGFF